MKRILLLLAFTFFFCITSYSQKTLKHKIAKGESVLGIAKKYGITEKDIYELNPKVKGKLLQLNQVLSIPNKKYKEKEKTSKKDKKELVDKNIKKDKKEVKTDLKETKEITVGDNEDFLTHKVETKETLYSISKKYGITMETICEINPVLKTENFKKGMHLKIPKNPVVDSTAVILIDEVVDKTETKTEQLVHKVLAKETLFKIAKQYGVSVADIQKLNPGIGNELKKDYLLIIKNSTIDSKFRSNDNSKSVSEVEEGEIKDVPAVNLNKAEILIQKASEHIGTRYRSGGTTSAGFDCSGLIFSTFQNIDMKLPRTSSEMSNFGIKINKAQAQKGDLIFFATFGGKRVSHVGMVTEVNNDGEIKFIHSSSGSGVTISSLNDPYYTRTYVQINRVLTE